MVLKKSIEHCSGEPFVSRTFKSGLVCLAVLAFLQHDHLSLHCSGWGISGIDSRSHQT